MILQQYKGLFPTQASKRTIKRTHTISVTYNNVVENIRSQYELYKVK